MSELDQGTASLLKRAVSVFEEVIAQTDDDVEMARQYTAALLSEFAGAKTNAVHVSEYDIETESGFVPTILYRPKDAAVGARLPLVVFSHGGGWCVGDIHSYNSFMEALCAASGIMFLSVGYRRAPEHKFPIAHNECFDVLQWAFQSADLLCVDPSAIAVMGDSAGANIALVSAWRIHTETDFRLSAQYLLYPLLDMRDQHELYPSRMAFGDGNYLLGRGGLTQAKDWYAGLDVSGQDPFLSPLFLSGLGKLPPTVLVTAGFDPLMDEAIEFKGRLEEAKVPVLSRHFETTIHGFLPFGALPIAQKAQSWLAADLQDRLRSDDTVPFEYDRAV